MLITLYFYFQAEDGIRDGHVTGVQTCALPILTKTLAWDLLSREQDSVLGFAFFDVNFGTQLHNYDAAGIGMCILMNHARDNGALQFCIGIICAVCFYFTQALVDGVADSRCRDSPKVGGSVIKFGDDFAAFIDFGNDDRNFAGISINIYAGLMVFLDVAVAVFGVGIQQATGH